MNGLVIGTAQTFAYFEKIQERIVDFVTKNSHISADDFRTLMLRTGSLASDVGTILYGREAVDHGIIDALGGLSDALDWLHERIRERREG